MISCILANGVTFKQKYQENTISIEKTTNNPITFNVDATATGEVKYAYLNKEDYTIIFITRYQTFAEKPSDETYNEITSYNLNLKRFSQGVEISDSNVKSKIKVYYTDTNFKKIATSTNEEFNTIINNSKLLYID